MTLVFAVMHLYVLEFFIASVHSFFILFLKSGVDKSTEWSTIPACPSVTCLFFLTQAMPKGLILQQKIILMFVYVYFKLCQD